MIVNKFLLLTRSLILLLLLLTVGVANALEQGDGPVFDRIESLRPVAAAIIIDGLDGDWGEIPAFPDPLGDTAGSASRDITSVSIAPLDDALLVRIATAAPPPDTFLNFWLDIDYRSEQFLDLQLGLDSTFDDLLWIYPEDAGAFLVGWEHAELAVGNVVEARIPYALLEAALPPSMQGQLSGPGARSWLRVTPFSVGPGGVEDYGSAVASFRLVETPYLLDPPLPPGGGDPVALSPPLAGKWYVGQGAMTRGSHFGLWGYDLYIVDNALHPDDPFGSPNNEDYFSFGQAVRAPVGATVFSLDDSQPDLDPRTFLSPPTPPNFVFLDIGADIGILFSHLRQGSVPLVQGQSVAAGNLLGEVGHSGSTTWSHLHLEAQQIDNGFASTPIALTSVEVGLNPLAEDPWRRRLASWDMREGFLVEPDLGLTISGSCPGQVTVAISGASPGGSVALVRGSGPGSLTVPSGPCQGLVLGLEDVQLVTFLTADPNGAFQGTGSVSGSACGIPLQTADVATCTASNVVTIP